MNYRGQCHGDCVGDAISGGIRFEKRMLKTTVGCAGFGKKMFHFKAKRDLFRMRFARSREKKFVFTSFRFISLPTKAKLIERIERNRALFRFQIFFVSLRFASDLFVSLQSETK